MQNLSAMAPQLPGGQVPVGSGPLVPGSSASPVLMTQAAINAAQQLQPPGPPLPSSFGAGFVPLQISKIEQQSVPGGPQVVGPIYGASSAVQAKAEYTLLMYAYSSFMFIY